MPIGNIMRVPAASAPGRGYAQPGNRGFTGWRTTTFGVLAGTYGDTDVSLLASAHQWQRTSPSPRPRNTSKPPAQFMATVPVSPSGGAPPPAEQMPVASVDDVAAGPTATSCKPCMAFKLGALLVLGYAIYKAAT